MNDQSTLEALRGLELLRGIADSHLTRLAEISRREEYPARTEIFRESEVAKDVYLVLSGRVALIICEAKVGCRQLMEVREGEMIGWSPLVGRLRLSDTARTLEPTVVLAIDGDQLLNLCREDTEFGFQFMHRAAQVLAERLNATRMKLLEMGGNRLPDVPLESD